MFENPPGPGQRVWITLIYYGQKYTREVGPDDYLSQREAAFLLNKSVMAITKWIRSGSLKATKKRGFTMIRWRDLKKFGEERGFLVQGGTFEVG